MTDILVNRYLELIKGNIDYINKNNKSGVVYSFFKENGDILQGRYSIDYNTKEHKKGTVIYGTLESCLESSFALRHAVQAFIIGDL